MSTDGIGLRIRIHIVRTYGKQKNAAQKWGVSQAYVSKLVNEESPPPTWLLEEMGLERRVIYVAHEGGLW